MLSFFIAADILMNWRVHSKRKCGILYYMVQFDCPFVYVNFMCHN